jgi:hypothetical protein
MSAIRGSSGFGWVSSICREVSKPLSVTTGRHVPLGGRRSKSRHIRPATSTFGWYTGVVKRKQGGSNGYLQNITKILTHFKNKQDDMSVTFEAFFLIP